MESPLVRVFGLVFLHVTVTSSHVLQGNNNKLKYIDNDIVKTIVVNQYGKGDYKTIQSAIDSVPSGNDHWIKIYVSKGIHNEKLIIPRDKRKIQMVGNQASETIVQYNNGGQAIDSATLLLRAEYFIAVNITFKNTYNEDKPMTQYRDIKVAPAVVLAADKAAFYGCAFYSIQDTIGDVAGRHFFQHCHIKGVIDFIWGGGQSIYQGCVIEVLGVTTLVEGVNENGGMIAGFITAQGRETEQDTSGFVFNGCSIVGVGKAFLGRAYRGYSRVIFSNTQMSNVVVTQGWDAWAYPKQVDKLTYAEVNCRGPGAKKEGRVAWEKNMSSQDVSYFTNRKTFIDKDGWIETLPPHPFSISSLSSDSDENSFG
ncbi:unnamed protein product [Cochlearia groenlandica]